MTTLTNSVIFHDSGYTDPKTKVVKFRQGLSHAITTALASMVIGRPSDRDPEQWFRLAVQMDQNRAADEAFYASSPSTPIVAAQASYVPTSDTCNQCGAAGHLDEDCPHQFDAQYMGVDKVQAILEARPPVLDQTPVQPKKFHPQPKARLAVPLSSKNHFSVLAVDEALEPLPTSSALPIPSTPSPLGPAPKMMTRRPRWEKRMTRKLIIRSLEEGPNCLMIPTHLKTTDTMEEAATEAMVDTGATGDFIDRDFVERTKLPTRKLSQPIPVYNVDGTPNEAGSIDRVVDVIMTYKGHSERILLAVTRLGKQSMILGFTWLKKHNPEIDFIARVVKMSRCMPRCCTGCRTDLREERKAKKEDIRCINACCTGPLPAFVEDADDEEEQLPDPEDPEDEPLEEGDRIWATGLLPEPEYIRASSTISQRLAEAFKKNSQPLEHEKHIPPHLRDFHSVFSKESFDDLPESKPWDHAVELTPDATPKSCKVYPLAASEQKELDAFLKENLETGRIRPSKSPMASPVFFIKKKDGALHLVQDYCMLNAMTVKNKYPLPLIPELIAKLWGAKYFTKLDVRWGFNNVRMKEGDEWKAAFQTNRGLFEPLVMFFGLTNSPATFQTMMDDIFEELITEGVVVVYLDDILIFTETLEEHHALT